MASFAFEKPQRGAFQVLADRPLLVVGDLSDAQRDGLAEAAADRLPPVLFALPQAVPALVGAVGIRVEQARFFKLGRPAEAGDMFSGLGAADLYFKQWLEAPGAVAEGVVATDPPVAGSMKVGDSTVYFCALDPVQVQGERQGAKALHLVGTLLANAARAANADLAPLDLTAGEVEIGADGSPYAVQALTYNPYKYRRW